jgi:hypothetical protein
VKKVSCHKKVVWSNITCFCKYNPILIITSKINHIGHGGAGTNEQLTAVLQTHRSGGMGLVRLSWFEGVLYQLHFG